MKKLLVSILILSSSSSLMAGYNQDMAYLNGMNYAYKQPVKENKTKIQSCVDYLNDYNNGKIHAFYTIHTYGNENYWIRGCASTLAKDFY